RTVVGDDRDDVARLESERDQSEPDVARPFSVLAPADGAPDSQLLLPHGDLVTALRHDVPKQLGQGLLSVHGPHLRVAPGSLRVPRLRSTTRLALLIEDTCSTGPRSSAGIAGAILSSGGGSEGGRSPPPRFTATSFSVSIAACPALHGPSVRDRAP